jgi:hypothetical protein
MGEVDAVEIPEGDDGSFKVAVGFFGTVEDFHEGEK